MRSYTRCTATVLLSAFLLAAASANATGVEVLFDPDDRSKTIFPSDLFTTRDFSQNTFRRVDLAKPDCAVNPVPCWDIDVLNTLDGFNIQPRISIPFSGPIDVSTVNSDSIFLVSLGSTRGRGSVGDRVGINQVVWDADTNTLHVESEELLEQHTRYAVIVTDRVRDANGRRLKDEGFSRFHSRRHSGNNREAFLNDFRENLLEAFLNAKRHHGRDKVVAASVFTTMSTSGTLEKIRDQIKAATPGPTKFNVGSNGERAVFPLETIAGVQFVRQTGTAPVFTASFLPTPALNVVPGAVATLAFGSYASPNYLAPDVTVPSMGSRTGVPVPQTTGDIHFNLTLPAGPRPAAGWPVAIFGHGFTDSRFGAFFTVASVMASRGIATMTINVVGHGGGPLGTVNVIPTASAPVVVPAGGRGIDQNGDGLIGSSEGSASAAPRLLIGSADALRQTTVDLMQLVRQIQAGVDVDGDGTMDLDAARIYYFGQSFGGIYGTIFLGVERDVRVGVPNVPGGPIIDIVRLSPGFRAAIANPTVAARGLLNAGAQFDENLPLRNEPPRLNGVAGAMALQDFIDQAEWASQPGNPVAYAPFLRKSPLRGNPAKSVILQYAKGDQTVPNPTATAIVRAGELQDRATYFRNDLAFAGNPAVPKNPHTFLTNIGVSSAAGYAIAAQTQIALFFAGDGAAPIDPDGAAPFFEVPIVLPLPETLNYIP